MFRRFPAWLFLLAVLIVFAFVFSCVSGGDDDDDDNDDNDDDDNDDNDDDNNDDDNDDTGDDDTGDDDTGDDDTGDDDTGDDDDDDSAGEVWTDLLSQLMWQNDSDCCYSRDEATAYCADLTWGGHSDWRLPSISEFRSLIRGCTATRPAGSCGVKDSCRDLSCRDSSCYGCTSNEGPAEGCYWPFQMHGYCGWYWSSSAVADDDALAWSAGFAVGGVDDFGTGFGLEVRCVR